MQLACKTRDNSRREHTDHVKNMSVLLHGLHSSGRHLLGVSYITILKSHFCTAHALQKVTVLSHNHKTFQHCSSVCILTGINQVLVTNNGQSAFPSISLCQGQL